MHNGCPSLLACQSLLNLAQGPRPSLPPLPPRAQFLFLFPALVPGILILRPFPGGTNPMTLSQSLRQARPRGAACIQAWTQSAACAEGMESGFLGALGPGWSWPGRDRHTEPPLSAAQADCFSPLCKGVRVAADRHRPSWGGATAAAFPADPAGTGTGTGRIGDLPSQLLGWGRRGSRGSLSLLYWD